VVLLLGVNGTGKTTTAAKLAHRTTRKGGRALLAATDTFRSGAQEQLRIWAERLGTEFVGGQPGADPAAVAWDAATAAASRGVDLLVVDTAGRLHTQRGLVEELRKIDRVVGRVLPGAPHERLLVVDATAGQNVIHQAREFGEALPLTGIVLSKFDSSARGGTAVAVAREFGVSVRWLGTGESPDDLAPFDPEAYVEKLLAG
jgi:fused signal recognition particle receptor